MSADPAPLDAAASSSGGDAANGAGNGLMGSDPLDLAHELDRVRRALQGLRHDHGRLRDELQMLRQDQAAAYGLLRLLVDRQPPASRNE